MEIALTAVAVTISALTFVLSQRNFHESASQTELNELRIEVRRLREENLNLTREVARLSVLVAQQSNGQSP